MRSPSLLFSTLVFLVGAPVAAQEFKYEKKIEELVQPYLDKEKFVGISVGVILGDETHFANFGKTESNGKRPTKDTVYEIGSISKVMTGVLLADAVERGELSLDQKLGSLIDGLQEARPELAEVTLQQLSNHVSGLSRMPSNLAPADPMNPFKDYSREKLDAYLKNKTTPWDKSRKHVYSNLAVGLLGDLLSRETEEPYETLLMERICKPLKMDDTSIDVTGERLKRFAGPHSASLKSDYRWDFDALVGAGGIRSTTNDMVKFMRANLNRPDDAIGKALTLAYRKQADAGEGHRAMGLGWMIAGDGLTRWHNGQTGGYQSMMLVNRSLKAGVIVLSNTAGSEIDPLAEGIFQAIVGMQVEPRDFSSGTEVDAKVVKRLAGKYQLAPGVVIEVTAKNQDLFVQLTGQTSLQVFPESDTVWNYRAVKAQLKFDLPDDEQPATKVTLLQNGRVLPAPRIK